MEAQDRLEFTEDIGGKFFNGRDCEELVERRLYVRHDYFGSSRLVDSGHDIVAMRVGKVVRSEILETRLSDASAKSATRSYLLLVTTLVVR